MSTNSVTTPGAWLPTVALALGAALTAAGALAACGDGGANGSATDSGKSTSSDASASTGSSSGSSASAGDGSASAAGDDGSAPSGVGGGDAGPTLGDASAPTTRKRGLAYGSNSDGDMTALSAGIGWWYNWSPSPDGTLKKAHPEVDFVPMIWGGTFDTTKLAAQIPANAKYLLTFNEPNFGAQANLTPAAAAALWPKVEAFAKAHHLAIVSPALNYCGGSCNVTNPFDWLDQFFAACTGCKVDYVAAHWYACSSSALQNYLSTYESKYKQPIWLTEFSCLDNAPITEAKEETYMKDAVALLEADAHVFRYAWFTGRDPSQAAVNVLAPDSGVLTPLGKQYVSLPAH